MLAPRPEDRHLFSFLQIKTDAKLIGFRGQAGAVVDFLAFIGANLCVRPLYRRNNIAYLGRWANTQVR
ncbi:MAG: hypothetical protein ABI597_09845, partial [Gammaproteobacteria bacterium]